ncbi:MAG: hypothetical protein PHR78_07830, partial [Eubacteriales bacterium]|nr:hypothetical protein [Eubacteriales bacterium]
VLVHRYNEWGEKIAEITLPRSVLLPAIYLLDDECSALFNNETVLLLDMTQEKILYEASFEEIEDLALTQDNMALLLDEGETLELKILRRSEGSFSLELLDSFTKLGGEILLANSRETIFLAQDNIIRAYDFASGKFVAESVLSEPVINLIAQDNNTLIVLTEQSGYLYSLD